MILQHYGKEVLFVEKGQLVAIATKSKWKTGWNLEIFSNDSVYEIDSLNEGETVLRQALNGN